MRIAISKDTDLKLKVWLVGCIRTIEVFGSGGRLKLAIDVLDGGSDQRGDGAWT